MVLDPNAVRRHKQTLACVPDAIVVDYMAMPPTATVGQVADLLREAERLRHPRGEFVWHDDSGNDCALGYIHLRLHGMDRGKTLACRDGLNEVEGRLPIGRLYDCPACGQDSCELIYLVGHLNDDHEMSFGQIADALEAARSFPLEGFGDGHDRDNPRQGPAVPQAAGR